MGEPREGEPSHAEIDRRDGPTQEAVDARAAKLEVDEGDEHPELTDEETVKRAARHILEDSEARTQQAADLDPEDDTVIRRTSSETAREVH